MKFRYIDTFKNWRQERYYYAKKKGFRAEIRYAFANFLSKEEYWYMLIENKQEDKRYNSLWDKKKYDDPNIAMKDAEEWIDNYVKGNKS